MEGNARKSPAEMYDYVRQQIRTERGRCSDAQGATTHATEIMQGILRLGGEGEDAAGIA